MEILFDFDGTLAGGCCYTWRWQFALARRHGFMGTEHEALAALGDATDFDAAHLLALPVDPEGFTQALIEENRRSLARAYCDPDLHRVLDELATTHSLHVLSNRDQDTLEEGLGQLGLRRFFQACVGVSPGMPGKPERALLDRLRERAPARGDAVVYVGDKAVDRVFAAQMGMGFVAACWYHDALANDACACLAVTCLESRLAAREVPWASADLVL